MARRGARAKRPAGRCDPHRRRPHRARFHARGAVVVAPALRRLGGVRRARRRPRATRARVPQHRGSDGVALPRRLGRVPLDLARAERRGLRAPRPRRRRGLAAAVRGVHALRGPELRCALGRAVVAAGRQAGAPGLPPSGSARVPLVQRRHAHERARLARGDVRIRRRARAARAVGAAHRSRARAGRGGLHDAGDRLCDPARRHARAEGRRHPAGRGARRDRA